MALQVSDVSGVVLDSVWCAFRDGSPSSAALAASTGWAVPTIETIEAYRGATSRYFFPTLRQLRRLIAPWFIELACEIPTYELGERCPTLTLERR